MGNFVSVRIYTRIQLVEVDRPRDDPLSALLSPGYTLARTPRPHCDLQFDMHLLSFAIVMVFAITGAPRILGATTGIQRDVASGSQRTPTRVQPVSDALHTLAAAVREPGTNAERLTRGLPPRAPALAMGRGYSSGRRGENGRAQQYRSPRPSATPCKLQQETGFVSVHGEGIQGFLTPRTDPLGIYILIDNRTDDALKVVLNRCDGSSKPFEITTLNGFDDFPLLGAVSDTTVGEALRKGSSGSIRVAGVTSVPFGPARHGPNAVTSHIGTPFRIESAVWTLRGQTLQLTWVNPNGRAQGLIPVAVAETVGFILSATADVDQFRQTTSATVTVVTLTFLPA